MGGPDPRLSRQQELTSRALDRVGFVLATWFGCGLSSLAPGTVGSLGAVPLFLALRGTSIPVYVAVVVGVTVLGVWAGGRVAAVLDLKDPQLVVIDEVAGTLIAMGAVRDFGVVAQVAALLLFRFFDITKLGPIRRAEHLRPPGVGIMADDVLAGVAAAIVARAGALLLG